MLITVLAVPGCPHVPLLIKRLEQALGDAWPAEVVVVESEAEAAARGMCGSPTLLVDGIDPFPRAGAQPSLSCRLYAGADGALTGVPSVEQLRGLIAHRSAASDG